MGLKENIRNPEYFDSIIRKRVKQDIITFNIDEKYNILTMIMDGENEEKVNDLIEKFDYNICVIHDEKKMKGEIK